MSSMSFWGCVVKPGKAPTKLKRDPEDASIVLKQVRQMHPLIQNRQPAQ